MDAQILKCSQYFLVEISAHVQHILIFNLCQFNRFSDWKTKFPSQIANQTPIPFFGMQSDKVTYMADLACLSLKWQQTAVRITSTTSEALSKLL